MIFVSSVVNNHKNLFSSDKFLKFIQYFATYENNISRSATYCGHGIKNGIHLVFQETDNFCMFYFQVLCFYLFLFLLINRVH